MEEQEQQENRVQLLLLRDQWLVARVEELGGVEFGDPDCVLYHAKQVKEDGELTPWPPHSEESEVVIRSSDILVLVNPSKKTLARYIETE